MSFLAVLLGAFVVAYIMIGAVVLRRPLIARIAFREAGRRPGQTVVLILGLMIAGAAIFSIQVIEDTMYESYRAHALQSWGRDDIEISAGGGSFDPSVAQRVACSCVAAVQNAVITAGSVVNLDREVGKANVQITGLDLAAQQRFGPFVLAGGRSTLGDELTSGGVFLTEPLAGALQAQAGDHLRVITGAPSSHDVTVAGIVRREAAGAYGFDDSMFASIATAQTLAGVNGVNLIRVSAPGVSDAEVTNAQAAAPVLRTMLQNAGVSLQVLEVKRGALEIVLKTSEQGRPFVSSFGVIIALAATALVVNLAVMLSEERRPRLAVLRAMGLTRAGLVQLSTTEGAIYSLLGAIAGLPAGLLLAFFIYKHGFGAAGPQLFSVHVESLLGSVAAAALINLITVFIVSMRTNAMTISAAIRDLPEPRIARRPSRKRLAFIGVVALAGLFLLVAGNGQYAIVGGALIIAAVAGVIQGRVSDRLRYSAGAAAAAAWAVADFQLAARDVTNPGPFAYALIVLVLAFSVLVATNLSLLESAIGLLGRVSAGSRVTLRPAIAYSSRRPLRSGLVIAAFAIVMAMLVLAQSLVSAQGVNYRAQSGGWDVQAVVAGTDALLVPAALRSEVAAQTELPSRTFLGSSKWTFSTSDFRSPEDWHQEPITVFGVSPQQLETGMGFVSPTATAAEWMKIAHDPTQVASTNSTGSVISMKTDHGTVSFTVAATIPSTNTAAYNSVVPGLIASRAALDMLGGSAPGAMLLLNPAPGVSASTLSRDLQRATLSAGVDVSTTKALLDHDSAISSSFGDFIILLMRIGLTVGIASLGAVALRAVIERRRSIGMLRAVGYQPVQVLAGLLAETAALATAGLAVGLTVAFLMGGTVVSLLASDAQYRPDYGSAALTIALVYVAVLLVTLLPALQASRLRPAEALRATG
ncbi:MAG TPA: FtsX-like permease family protein [Candidatus Dormibacteraeota bacterium]|nr:FtsX-like permease family protein [Candidatus Dormibacteraeota bacterium]